MVAYDQTDGVGALINQITSNSVVHVGDKIFRQAVQDLQNLVDGNGCSLQSKKREVLSVVEEDYLLVDKH